MRIGISTSMIQRGKTGIGQYLFALLRAFKKYTDQHEFVLFILEEDLPLFDFVDGKMKIVPIAEKFRSAVKNILWHQTELPRLAGKLKLDVLHIPSYRRLLWQQPCALVATIHDLAPFHLANKYDWKRMFYGRVVVKRLAHRQHEIIAISQNTARDVAHFFEVPSERITVVHNGVDHERFQPGSKEAARKVIADKHGIKSPFFLYMARLEHPAKNHVRLIEAFNLFKLQTGSDWHLVFGGSDWHGAEEIHKKIKASPLTSHIRSLGFVPDNDLPTLYRAADCFVYPSLFEGFGLPPIEAMACGCPVISSARGSLAEVVGNSAIIIDPENVAQMRQELAGVAADADLRENLSRTGLEHAKLFNWHHAAEKTLQIYSRAFQGQLQPTPASGVIPVAVTRN
ncbi:MAG: glycosyltransferase family 4 protein [Verrucomicrobia bacterium]|nr:glycosyltransferase family 4 protein [Verrucomicrobiota bacterium]